MDLKIARRQAQARRQAKEPLPRSLFTRVGGLVRRHRLDGAFCRLLADLHDHGVLALARTYAARSKADYQPPLFFLATAEEFSVIKEILSLAPNLYLAFAHSPEEILLSGPLYDRQPHLSPEVLITSHFAKLFVDALQKSPSQAGATGRFFSKP